MEMVQKLDALVRVIICTIGKIIFMSAKDDILNNKYDILKEKGTISKSLLVDHLFENFVKYASANWQYVTQAGSQTADDLLSGTGMKSVACGTLRTAFITLVRNDLQGMAAVADLNQYFISLPNLKCFDNNVTGNVANPGSPFYTLGCHFSAHYFAESEGKFYDPCLSAIYATKEEPILIKTRIVTKSVEGALRYGGVGRSTVILKRKVGVVPGFGSTWEMFSLFKDNVSKMLSAAEFAALKAQPELKAAGLK
ncbi:hypothetical protein BH10BAC3_BH10BAC3_12220 [soil metagenome]